MRAKVAYTYGWTDDQIGQMEYSVFLDYWLAITIIESEEQLKGIEVACSSIMSNKDRKSLISRYRNKAKSMINRSGGKLASIQDVAKAFARMQNNG